MGERAHRIQVDLCSRCPFLGTTLGYTNDADGCDHPLADGRAIVPGRQLIGLKPAPPPDWCPLRGGVTLVAGPSMLTEVE